MRALKLTLPDGDPVWITDAWIQGIRKPLQSEQYGSSLGTVLLLSGRQQYVREAPDVVAEMLAQ